MNSESKPTRLFAKLALSLDTTVTLPPEVSHHLVTVLRSQPGDKVQIFNGLGGEYECELVTSERHGAQVNVLAFNDIDREASTYTVLAQAIAKGTKTDLVIQKATELGASVIQPFLCERSNVKLAGDKREERHLHYRKVAISACEQCGRNTLPELRSITTLQEFLLRQATADDPDHLSLDLIFDPTAEDNLTEVYEHGYQTVRIAIGPEGGFSPKELERAERAGFRRTRLGHRTLRTETAGLAALAAIHALSNEF